MFQAQGTLLYSSARVSGLWLPFPTPALSFNKWNKWSVLGPVKDLHLYSGKDLLFLRILHLQLFFCLKKESRDIWPSLATDPLLTSHPFSPQSSLTELPSSLFCWDCVLRVVKPNGHFCYHTRPFRSIPNDVTLSLFISFLRYHTLQFYT